MKKLKVLALSLGIFFTCLANVYAECSLEESSKLNALGANVKADFEVVEKKIEPGENYNAPDGLTPEQAENYEFIENFFRIYISNITEELYVEVENHTLKEKKRYTYQDAVNGVITFDDPVLIEISKYTITVYSSSKTGCPDTKLSSITLETPMYNSLSASSLCEGIEDLYLCHKYLPVKVNVENYEKILNDYRQGKINSEGEEIKNNDTDKNSFIDFIKENKNIVIATVVLIVTIGGLVTVIIVRKQRSRVI